MNNVIDEVLAGEPRYIIKDNGGTTLYSNVQIELATTVTTQGTALNKALFDSIATDINSRLLISNKATDGEATAGRSQNASQMNDTKYMTPRTTQKILNSLVSYKNHSHTGTGYSDTTVVDFGTIYNANIVTVTGKVYISSSTRNTFRFNGTRISVYVGDESTTDSTIVLQPANRGTSAFQFKFDLNTFTFTGTFLGDSGVTSVLGNFDGITTFQIRTQQSQNFAATIQLNS